MIGRRLRTGSDEGFGLIGVIATTAIMLAFVTVITTVVVRSQRSAVQHTQFEQALAVAEYGLSQGLGRVDATYQATPATPYVSPSPGGDCNAPTISWSAASPDGTSASTDERAWARDWLLDLATVPGCLRSSTQPAAQYVFFRPSGRQTVYAMSFVPSYAATHRQSRLLKSEYIFAPYRPQEAVLTGGDLTIASSTTVQTASSGDASLAGVHSNGVITLSGNPTVSGLVSSSGVSSGSSSHFASPPNASGGGITNSPPEPVPNVSALGVYLSQAPNYVGVATANWYDLCSDGKVRLPSLSGPCQGTVLGDYSSGGLFNNSWSYQPTGSSSCPTNTAPCWLVGGNVPNGVYYVNGADVVATGGRASAQAVTIIAAAQDPTVCPKAGGNIVWDHISINAPALPGLFMLADSDLVTGPNFSAGSDDGQGHVVSGAFVAGDQISMQTSSAGAYGSIVAGDQCSTGGISGVTQNTIKNPSVYFDPTATSPISGVLDTTLWLEYPSGS